MIIYYLTSSMSTILFFPISCPFAKSSYDLSEIYLEQPAILGLLGNMYVQYYVLNYEK